MKTPMEDLSIYGVSITRDGKRIDPRDVWKKPPWWRRSPPTSFNLWCAAFSCAAAVLFVVDGEVVGAMMNLAAGILNYCIYRWVRNLRAKRLLC